MNFSRYLGILRINYITQLMYENEKYLNYTIQSLSDECGIASDKISLIYFRKLMDFAQLNLLKEEKRYRRYEIVYK